MKKKDSAIPQSESDMAMEEDFNDIENIEKVEPYRENLIEDKSDKGKIAESQEFSRGRSGAIIKYLGKINCALLVGSREREEKNLVIVFEKYTNNFAYLLKPIKALHFPIFLRCFQFMILFFIFKTNKEGNF